MWPSMIQNQLLYGVLDKLAQLYIYKVTSGQSYKAPTIVIYNSIVISDLKLPHITTLES